jgi:flavodoxin
VKTIIVYSSKHHQNTEKIAVEIAGELAAELRRVAEVKPEDIHGYDLVGFGSGINGFDVHPEITAFVKALPAGAVRRAFVFSTCASRRDWTAKLRQALAEKGVEVAGEFHCAGLWTPGPVAVRKGHPDAADLAAAHAFAHSLAQGESGASTTRPR